MKKEKEQNNDLQNMHINLKTEQHEPYWKVKDWDELGCSGRVDSSCSISGTHRVVLVTNPEMYKSC